MTKHVSLLALLALTSCATLTASGYQDIAITTEPAGANCMLSNTQQNVTMDVTPGVVSVKRMFEPLNITCTLPGYHLAETTIKAETRGRTYGNILLLGIPAIVDSSTGDGYEYDPDTIELKFEAAAQ